VKACPETSHHDVLGLINGKAVLIGPRIASGTARVKPHVPSTQSHWYFGTARRGLEHTTAQAELRI